MKLVFSLFAFILFSSSVYADTVAIIGGTIFKTPLSTPIEDGIILVIDEKIEDVGVMGRSVFLKMQS